MHLPLIDPPKPNRARRPRCASASVLFGACLALSWLYAPRPEPLPKCSCYLPIAPKASPVKYVTVTRQVWDICSPFHQTDPCVREYVVTEQMPLMELYDELCELEERAGPQWSTLPPSDTVVEQAFLRAEKEFAKKYGLTLEQVATIKREGTRLKQEMGE